MEGNDGDCDSMLLISLCYGKQTAVTEARAKEDSASADGYAGSAFSDEVLLNDVEQLKMLKHLLPYDMGLAEKDCAWHSPLLTFAQLKALKNMRIRTQQSEDRRRDRWVQKNERYQQNREDSRAERRERKDSVPPLRRDSYSGSYRNVGDTRSRSISRTRTRDQTTTTPQPPPAPVRAPVTPPKTSSVQPKQVRYKAAPASLKVVPTSTSNVTPPVKAPPVAPPAPPARSTRTARSARSPSNDPTINPSRTVGAKRPPWRERSQTPDPRSTRKRPYDNLA